jgi:hypothetical protein
LINAGKFVSSTLEVTIEHHINTRNWLVLEGDGIISGMVSRIVHKFDNKIRSVFLQEKNKGFFFNGGMSEEANNRLYQEKITIRMMYWLYNHQLVNEARERDLLIVKYS